MSISASTTFYRVSNSPMPRVSVVPFVISTRTFHTRYSRAKPREARQNAWISEETWSLIDERFSTRRDPRYGTVYRRRMGKSVQASLAADRRRRADEAAAEVGALVKADPPLTQEAWYRLQGWYKAAVDRAPPPARDTLKQVTAERVALYIRVPPPPSAVI